MVWERIQAVWTADDSLFGMMRRMLALLTSAEKRKASSTSSTQQSAREALLPVGQPVIATAAVTPQGMYREQVRTADDYHWSQASPAARSLS